MAPPRLHLAGEDVVEAKLVGDELMQHMDSADELLTIDVSNRALAGVGLDSYTWLNG